MDDFVHQSLYVIEIRLSARAQQLHDVLLFPVADPRVFIGCNIRHSLTERPEDFAKEMPAPEEMNFLELRSYIDRLRASGARVANFLVDLHVRLAFPLVNLIVVMIGASVATRLRMQSAAMGFGLSVAISFVYYAFMRTGQALGHNGALPPYLAAWLGDLAFGAVGLTMMAQAQRQ